MSDNVNGFEEVLKSRKNIRGNLTGATPLHSHQNFTLYSMHCHWNLHKHECNNNHHHLNHRHHLNSNTNIKLKRWRISSW